MAALRRRRRVLELLQEIHEDLAMAVIVRLRRERGDQRIDLRACGRIRACDHRPRSTFRKFGLGRNKIRELAFKGDIPGVIKASW